MFSWVLVWGKGTPPADDLRGWASPVATDRAGPVPNALAAWTRSSGRRTSRPPWAPTPARRRSARGRARKGAGRPSRGGRRRLGELRALMAPSGPWRLASRGRRRGSSPSPPAEAAHRPPPAEAAHRPPPAEAAHRPPPTEAAHRGRLPRPPAEAAHRSRPPTPPAEAARRGRAPRPPAVAACRGRRPSPPTEAARRRQRRSPPAVPRPTAEATDTEVAHPSPKPNQISRVGANRSALGLDVQVLALGRGEHGDRGARRGALDDLVDHVVGRVGVVVKQRELAGRRRARRPPRRRAPGSGPSPCCARSRRRRTSRRGSGGRRPARARAPTGSGSSTDGYSTSDRNVTVWPSAVIR